MTKKKLHILYLNSWYPSKVFPNNGDFIQRHAEAVATKHQVTSIHVVTDETISKTTITDNNVNGIRTIIAYLKQPNSNINKLVQFFKAYKKLTLLSGPFDIVHVNRLFPAGLVAVWIKKSRSIPFIISEHFTGYLSPLSNKLNKFEILFSKIITKQASFICPVSHDLAINMQKLGFNGNYHPIANTVNTKVFKPKNILIKESPLTIIHISSLKDDHKNITGILKTIANLQNFVDDFTFYLIGENPDQYQNLVDSLFIDKNKIKLIDQIPHQQVAKYLQKSDILILFSNHENLPCVILEAFACGTKVISTDIGGIKEFFPEDFGRLIPPKDENKLLESIIAMQNTNNFVSKSKMHQYAINNFSKEIICDKYSELYYKSLLNNNK